jgi:N12 class adenine-specific DNA methylase
MSSALIVTNGPKAEPRSSAQEDFSLSLAILSPLKDGQFYIGKNEAVYRRYIEQGDKLILAPEHVPVMEDNLKANTREKRDILMRLKLLIQMRDTVRTILYKQESTSDEEVAKRAEAPWAADQRRLKMLYDNFVAGYGPINRTELQQTGGQDETGGQVNFSKQPNLQRFRKDPDAMLVASIELYDEATNTAKPGPIFKERVLAARGKKSAVMSARDALRHVMSDGARLDLDAVAQLLPGQDPKDITDELARQELIFLNPATKSWQTAEEYLSGDIRAKLRIARAVAETDPAFAPTVAALEKVKPADLSINQIDVTFGAPWLPPVLVEDFGREVLGIDDIKVNYLPKTHKWFVEGKNSVAPLPSPEWCEPAAARHLDDENDREEAELEREPRLAPKRRFQAWMEEGKNRGATLEATLNREPFSYAARRSANDNGDDEGEDSVFSQKQDLPYAQQEIEDLFHAWIAKSPERTALVETIYNDRFNSDVTPVYDGSHMVLPGASVAIHPYPHQLDVVWRNIMRGNTLNAHPVGAGKTIEAIVSCVEMRRLGRIEKPLIVVPNGDLVKISRDFMSFYPNAHILMLDADSLDGGNSTERVEKFVQRARSRDWDAIIMTQENFDRFEVSSLGRLQILIDDIREFQGYAADPAYQSNQKIQNHLEKITRKKLTSLKDFLWAETNASPMPDDFDLKAALSHNADSPVWAPVVSLFRTPDWPSFEKIGVDYLFIDEAQNYRNLEITSANRQLALKGSARATNLRFKLGVLEAKRPGYYATLMTGTPIYNALSEVYTFQRYLDAKTLRDKGISNFNAWQAMFAKSVTTFEMAPEGNDFRYVTRLGRYQNVPELIRMFRSFTDTVDETKLNLGRPEINGGEPTTRVTPIGSKQKVIKDWLAARAKRVRSGQSKKEDDNILKIIVDGRRAALHSRLVWQRYLKDVEEGRHDGPIDVPDTPGKLNDMVAQIAKIYHANRDKTYYDINGQPEPLRGALQMVMCDNGVPGGKIDPSLYNEMRSQLVSLGVPFDAIRFEHDYKNDRKKAILSEQCRSGQVAVVIGTTYGLGTGSNVHHRLIALHELDEPWTPAGVRQRRGRIDRPGNANPQIDIIRYVTEGLHDVYSWQTILRKAKFIGQIMQGDMSIRRYDEIDPMIQEFATVLDKATNGDQAPVSPASKVRLVAGSGAVPH